MVCSRYGRTPRDLAMTTTFILALWNPIATSPNSYIIFKTIYSNFERKILTQIDILSHHYYEFSLLWLFFSVIWYELFGKFCIAAELFSCLRLMFLLFGFMIESEVTKHSFAPQNLNKNMESAEVRRKHATAQRPGPVSKCPDTSVRFIWYRSVLVPKCPGTEVSCYPPFDSVSVSCSVQQDSSN